MRAWIGSIKSQYYTIMKFDDKPEISFSVGGVPDQFTKVRIWLSNSFDVIGVTIPPKGTLNQPITKKGKNVGTVVFTRS
jgi:hypothetical protein